MELATLDGESTTTLSQRDSKSLNVDSAPETIVEAQGWVRTPDGQIALVAEASDGGPNSSVTNAGCPVSQPGGA